MANKNSFLWLAAFVCVAEAAGLIGTLFLGNIDTWYATLNKPFFSAPNWVFGPVWTILYALMGIAAFLVWRAQNKNQTALRLYWIQLALNAIWVPLFFGLRSLSLSLLDIVALLILIVATIIAFARVRTAAAFLLAPYLLWVLFATALNFVLWQMN
jgi:benzodiazapine receptor